ncbi:MAG TPA: alpha/beta fold hydrolase [Steroidobacteraceae bacterium]|nr:alpha/beta fold hydrolase [Steroidobacteraceae bacterium]
MNTENSAQESDLQRAEKRTNRVADVEARERLLAWMPVTERRLTLAGISTSVLEGGDGPPVVLLHGPLANAAHWLRVLPGLVNKYRVIAPDLPGHGNSQAAATALSVGRLMEWLLSLIEHTCSSAPALVGQLLGGAIAARFAGAHGRRVSRLVLIDTFGLAPFQPPPEFASALTDYMRSPAVATHERLWRQCAFDLERMRTSMGERWQPFEAYNVELARRPDVQSAVSALMEHFGPAIPHADLERIAVPAFLIWGRHDRPYPLSIATAASTRFGWPLHVIEDSADDPPIEQPEALLRVLHNVLGDSGGGQRKGSGNA